MTPIFSGQRGKYHIKVTKKSNQGNRKKHIERNRNRDRRMYQEQLSGHVGQRLLGHPVG